MGKAEGKDNFFAEDPLAFSKLIWNERKEQFRLAEDIVLGNDQSHFIFFDRGLADVTAYLRHTKSPQSHWEKELSQYPYDRSFQLLLSHRSIKQTRVEWNLFRKPSLCIKP